MRGNDWLPIFVRMEDQLVLKAGDYERISEFRSQNLVLKTGRRSFRFRKKAQDSFAKLRDKIDEMNGKGQLRGLRKFWIVNGFACRARLPTIESLAREKEISYIYFDRFAFDSDSSLPMSGRKINRLGKVLRLWNEPAPLPDKREDIPWNVSEIGADRAWKDENATGLGVTVAVIDSGILPTPSLVRALAKNPAEELNGKDDDGNGLIDDLFGYDFRSNTGYVLDDSKPPHMVVPVQGSLRDESLRLVGRPGLPPNAVSYSLGRL